MFGTFTNYEGQNCWNLENNRNDSFIIRMYTCNLLKASRMEMRLS